MALPSRSPYGERGLKYVLFRVPDGVAESLSLRRAWIEISAVDNDLVEHESLSLRRAWIEISAVDNDLVEHESLSLRRAWIEIGRFRLMSFCCLSLSLRRAWIEMNDRSSTHRRHAVALLTESVD